MSAHAFPDLPIDHPANRASGDIKHREGDQFSPKYDFEGRCAMAASLLSGFSTSQVAAAFGVNRRTVTKILPRASKYYRPIRDEIDRLGRVDFVGKYFTDSTLERLQKAATDPTIKMTYREADEAQTAATRGPNPRATSNQGVALLNHESKTYRVDVQWRDDTSEGWYFCMLDVEGLENAWLGTGDEGNPFITSQAAINAAKRWLIDNV